MSQETSDDRAFLDGVVHDIPGWLEDYTALRTMDILRFQEQRNLGGSVFEIGVFAGRYFSILLRSAQRLGSTIVGLDTFQYIDIEQTRFHLGKTGLAEYPKLSLIKAYSSEWSADALLAQLGGTARFVSIDGSHDKADVFWDLRLSERLCSVDGVVAVDDYLNPMTLGVNEAVNLFFSQPRNLVPWAYIANKLFLSRPGSAGAYRQFLENVVMQDDGDYRSQTFRQNLQNSRSLVEVTVFNHRIVILP